ncbi:MAG: response regulator transcription factor [Paludibacteraceae bacterium]|nr:response regulator transcription factor [Paludibacteraceae bacterium]
MEKQVKLLLCEDDENLGMLLREYLQSKDFKVTLAQDGEEGLAAFSEARDERFDICVLDVMIPKKDGFELARDIREIEPDAPIIFLTAKSDKGDTIEGLRLGDDYVPKPFSMEELVLRINNVLRRSRGKADKSKALYKLGELVFDTQKQTLTRRFTDAEGKSTLSVQKLTTKESELLALLASNANSILERQVALKTIWSEDTYFNARSMDVYITKLRKHLKEDPSLGIINIHGKGYKLIVPNLEEV